MKVPTWQAFSVVAVAVLLCACGAAKEDATAAPAPSDQVVFKMVQRRMWTKEENGSCAGQHLLRITVMCSGFGVSGPMYVSRCGT